MRRREIIHGSALFGLATSLGSLGACSRLDRRGPRASAASVGLTRLTAPPGGGLPAAFVIGRHAEVLDFTGPLEVFAGAATTEGEPLFSPYMVAATADGVVVGGGMTVVPDHTFRTAPQPRVIVIPAMVFSDEDAEMFEWIRAASRSCDVTMSVCNGAFLLARTGLLNGRSATAHHGGYFSFAASYPEVHLKRGARFVEDGTLASSGGVSAGIDLALRVVARYVGEKTAEDLADAIEYQGQGWLDPGSNRAYAKLPPLTGSPPRCPVCLSEAARTIGASHRGTTYFFCSGGCREMFIRHTDVFDRFLAEDARPG